MKYTAFEAKESCAFFHTVVNGQIQYHCSDTVITFSFTAFL